MAKVALFRGLFLINAAKRVVVTHLMWWWQLSMRYFWVLFFFICVEDELQWLGRALDPDFVMSEEELLLGQVSSTAIGLK